MAYNLISVSWRVRLHKCCSRCCPVTTNNQSDSQQSAIKACDTAQTIGHGQLATIMLADRQTYRLTDRQTNKQTDKPTDRQTDDKPTDYRLTTTYKQIDRQTDRQTNKQSGRTDRQTGRQTYRPTNQQITYRTCSRSRGQRVRSAPVTTHQIMPSRTRDREGGMRAAATCESGARARQKYRQSQAETGKHTLNASSLNAYSHTLAPISHQTPP